MKKVLMTSTVPSMISAFNMDNIAILHKMGYIVDVAADFSNTSSWTPERSAEFKRDLERIGGSCIQIPFSRSPTAFGNHYQALRELMQLLQTDTYDFVHTHSPIASAITRIAAERAEVAVMYTAHGFHFFDGAPLKNWLFYYPVERALSRWTKMLITINHEDFDRAKTRLFAEMTRYIPSVGFDYKRFSSHSTQVDVKRASFGVDPNDFLLLSVGELNDNKNHRVIIEALNMMRNSEAIDHVKYLIAGDGPLRFKLQGIIEARSLQGTVKLLGERDDVADLYAIADCYVHPSLREGFGIAPVEAMASGLPLISSYLHGMKDYVEAGTTGLIINPYLAEEAAAAIEIMYSNEGFRKACGAHNKIAAAEYDIERINGVMRQLYSELANNISKTCLSSGAIS